MKRAGGSRGDELVSVAPGLVDVTDRVLYGEVWERDQLAIRDRCLVTVSAIVATNHLDRLESHLKFALKNGVTVEELGEAFLQLAFYAGWPNSVGAARILYDIVEAQKAEAGEAPEDA